MIIFGNGSAFGRAKTDINGNVLATPTPLQFGVIQDLSYDIGREVKELYGEKTYAVAIGIGKSKITCKAKLGNYSAAMYGQLYAGRSASIAIKLLTTSEAFSVTASITVTPPNAGVYGSDFGVINVATGNPYRRVAAAPATGEYTVTNAGVYTFSAADAGQAALRTYEYSLTQAGSSLYNFTNDVMGLTPVFSYAGQTLYNGKRLALQFDNCVATKMSLPNKNDDFTATEFEFMPFDGGSGTLGYMTITEPS